MTIENTNQNASTDLDVAGSMNDEMAKQDAAAETSGNENNANNDAAAGEAGKENLEKEKKPVDEDPEYELDFEPVAGKGKAKFKLSDLKADAKWIYDNRDMIQGSMRMKDLVGQNPKFGEAMNAVIKSAFNDKGEFQQANVEKVLAHLSAKEEAIEQKIDQKDDQIDAMEKRLEELDPESPQYDILKSSLMSLKAVKTQLTQALDQNKKMSDRLDGLDKFKTDFTTEKETSAHNEKVKQVSTLYEGEIAKLTDANKKDGYKFVDDDEKAEFDRVVRDMVKTKAETIKSDQDFIKEVNDAAKVVYGKLNARRESIIADYHRKKGTGDGKPKEPVNNGDQKKPVSFEDMGAMIGDALMTPSK